MSEIGKNVQLAPAQEEQTTDVAINVVAMVIYTSGKGDNFEEIRDSPLLISTRQAAGFFWCICGL